MTLLKQLIFLGKQVYASFRNCTWIFSITAGIVGVFTAIVVASIRCHFLPLQSQYAYVITVTKNYARKLKDEQILPFDSSFAACNQWRCSDLNWLKILINRTTSLSQNHSPGKILKVSISNFACDFIQYTFGLLIYSLDDLIFSI